MSRHSSQAHRNAFRWSITLNAGLSGLQIVVGITFGSIALIGDAIHNFGDVIGLIMGWGAETLGHRAPTSRFSYGLGRSTQLAAVANAVLILMASAVLCVESFQRFSNPVPLVTGPIAWAAVAGLIVNLGSAKLFGDHDHDLNRKGAVVHLLSDAAVSAAVLLSTLLVGATGWYWLDPLTGLLVGCSIGWMGIGLLGKALAETMDAIPDYIDINKVKSTLQNIKGVESIHHLHIWPLSTSRVALTAHIVRSLSQSEADHNLISTASSKMNSLGIDHCTFQVESVDDNCDN
ncbi:cation diffusion facilitator family transporter [Synechococcus sp. CC9311]|uniref:cation diffusion facilitator family transporter n=1 Tax=Synechococcus sp. (strain CC9311) TaxID=64471 RepID=UPI0000DDABAA|nr:cation diffusion facilitator family transporter [Synechococcus sp. CC9311]ABI47768.1 cation efflux system protein [Synechococcus sp. CC9311]